MPPLHLAGPGASQQPELHGVRQYMKAQNCYYQVRFKALSAIRTRPHRAVQYGARFEGSAGARPPRASSMRLVFSLADQWDPPCLMREQRHLGPKQVVVKVCYLVQHPKPFTNSCRMYEGGLNPALFNG